MDESFKKSCNDMTELIISCWDENNPDDGGVYLTKYARRRFFMQYEEYMERFFKEDKTAAHVTFRRVIRNMVNTICQILEARVEPEFFIMP